MNAPKIAYVSFDVVPAPKGASIHIQAFAQTLSAEVGSLSLVTVSPTGEVIDRELDINFHQVALPALGKTLIDRVLHFRQQLWQWLQGRYFDIIHIRSPFEGFPIALHKPQLCRFLIFEVNGLPSIELKYRYPKVADDLELMHKLIAQEDACLQAADCVITPSPVTEAYLLERGVGAEQIQTIPNGVDLDQLYSATPRQEPILSPIKLLYFGTLSPWQGVDIAIDALALYCRDFEAQLTIVASGRPDQFKALHKLADRLSVAERIQWMEPMAPSELIAQMHDADVILAPLKACDRNLVQGCCPLKVLEGMASGTPVITTDLPVIHAIGTPDENVLAVRPNSAKAMKDALLRLREDAELRSHLSKQARTHIEQHYSWDMANQQLITTYHHLLSTTHCSHSPPIIFPHSPSTIN